MHLLGVEAEVGVGGIFGGLKMVLTVKPIAYFAKTNAARHACSSQSPLAGQVKQSSGWSEMYSSITLRRSLASRSFWVVTCMPSTTGVVQEAGSPRRPSTCTAHNRQEPNGSRLSVAHNLGILISASAAARSTEVPSGTVMVIPSISRFTSAVPVGKGVPRSLSWAALLAYCLASKVPDHDLSPSFAAR